MSKNPSRVARAPATHFISHPVRRVNLAPVHCPALDAAPGHGPAHRERSLPRSTWPHMARPWRSRITRPRARVLRSAGLRPAATWQSQQRPESFYYGDNHAQRLGLRRQSASADGAFERTKDARITDPFGAYQAYRPERPTPIRRVSIHLKVIPTRRAAPDLAGGELLAHARFPPERGCVADQPQQLRRTRCRRTPNACFYPLVPSVPSVPFSGALDVQRWMLVVRCFDS